MKTVRILLLLALCGAANMSQAMWLRAGKAIASRLATRSFKPMQPLKAPVASQYKPMAAFRTSLLKNLNKKRAMAGFTLFGATATGAASYAYQHRTSQELPFSKQGGTISINSLAGTINVEGWYKDRLEIKTCKEAQSQDVFDRSKISFRGIERDKTALFATIEDKTMYDFFLEEREYTVQNPPRILANIDNELTADGKPLARIRYDIKAPYYSRLIVKNIAGNIALKDIFGSVSAESVSGNIETTHCNNVKAETISGNVALEESYGKAEAKSMSGNVSITNNQLVADELKKLGLADTKGFDLEHATATSMSGSATVSGAQKGKAASVSGKASFNGHQGSSIFWE